MNALKQHKHVCHALQATLFLVIVPLMAAHADNDGILGGLLGNFGGASAVEGAAKPGGSETKSPESSPTEHTKAAQQRCEELLGQLAENQKVIASQIEQLDALRLDYLQQLKKMQREQETLCSAYSTTQKPGKATTAAENDGLDEESVKRQLGQSEWRIKQLDLLRQQALKLREKKTDQKEQIGLKTAELKLCQILVLGQAGDSEI